MPVKDGANSAQLTAPKSPKRIRVGEYLIGKTLNKGSLGSVVEGIHIPTGHKVAIKIVDKAQTITSAKALKNIQREIKIQKELKHPNIVPLYEVYETTRAYYLIMELCEGGDLLDKLLQKKTLKEQEAKIYISQLVDAVDHLHQKGIVHRDIKLENILLDEDHNVKLVDFGLSNKIGYYGSSPQPLTTQCGTLVYAAPELIMGRPYDAKVDVWSICVTIYALLTGNFPQIPDINNLKNSARAIKELDFPSDLSKGTSEPPKDPDIPARTSSALLQRETTNNLLPVYSLYPSSL